MQRTRHRLRSGVCGLVACLLLVISSLRAQTLPQRINDSGLSACYQGAGDAGVSLTACSNPAWPGQDGASGRDAAALAGTLTKIGAGRAGFDFSKVSNVGADLPAFAALGTAPAAWGCTRDNVTGLLWRALATPAMSWHGARHLVLAANAGNGWCGHRDWRLPSTRELQDTIDYGVANPAIDTAYFPATASDFHWSAEADVEAPATRARSVNHSGGYVNAIAATAAADVRLVRGGATFDAPLDSGDGSVTDARSALMWDRCSLGQNDAEMCAGEVDAWTWEDALQAVAQRNAQQWRGYSDWRLPNAKELASLLDPARGAPMIDRARFPNTPGAAYWSSTTNVGERRTAWAVFFGNASVFALDKITPARVRLVRTVAAAPIGGAADPLFGDGFDLLPAPPVEPADLLAVLSIDTAGAPILHDVYVAATITITSPDPQQNYSGTMTIKGRGNSTWNMPKKPYRMKLDSKHALLGMPEDKNWLLLANYDDKSLMRNVAALSLGDRLGMAWNPRTRFAEVQLNGAYLGVYALTESIRVAPDRIDITEMDAGDIAPETITGGYVLEIDSRRDCAGNVQFDSALGVPYCIDTPDEGDIVAPQYDYIRDYVADTESALYAADFADPLAGYAAWLDTASFIDWYLVNELFKNVDAQSFSSVWQYKDRGGKLQRGPLWDFDISAGNMNYGPNADPRGFWIRGGTYYARLFQDPTFATATRARWNAVKAAQIDPLPDLIDATAASFGSAVAPNFQQWPILDRYVWPNAVVTGSFEGDVAYLKDWLRQRIDWLDANL